MKITRILLHRHISFLLPRNITTFFSTRNGNPSLVLRHETRGIVMLHLKRKEEKLMYGSTKKNRKGTLKKSTDDSNGGNVTVDSEQWWYLKSNKSKSNSVESNSSKSQNMGYSAGGNIKRIKLIPKDPLIANDKDRILSDVKKGIIKSKRSDDVQEIEIRHDKEHVKNKNEDAATATAIPNDFKTLQEENIKLPNVRVNDITNFPIFTDRKEAPTKDNLGILSVSLEDYPEMLYYPSVTKILSATMSPQAQRALLLWKMKMTREMGEEKFNEYQRELLNRGTEFHSCIEDTLLGRKVLIPKHIQAAYNSLSYILDQLEDVKAVESFVSHKDLCYKGKIDCIASYRGKLHAIDWKKSDKNKGNINLTYDAPLQLAAYIGAINSSKIYPFTIECGLIVVGYTNGEPADTFFVSDEALKTYWEKWLSKLEQYWSNVQSQKKHSN